jgi:hypothetical protein
MLKLAQHVLALLGVHRGRACQVHDQRGRLRVLGHVDDLLETGHTQSDVLGGHTGVVKGVEGHLGGGLTDRLGRQRPDHFACLGLGLLEAGLDLADEPVEGLLGHLELLGDALGGEVGAQEDLHEGGGVLVGGDAELVVAADDGELLAEIAHVLDDLDWVKVGGSAQVDVEDLLSVDDKTL